MNELLDYRGIEQLWSERYGSGDNNAQECRVVKEMVSTLASERDCAFDSNTLLIGVYGVDWLTKDRREMVRDFSKALEFLWCEGIVRTSEKADDIYWLDSDWFDYVTEARRRAQG
jgi:hypothetical protein